MEQYQPAVTEGQVLDQRIGERLYHMTLLPEKDCHALKDIGNPFSLLSPANKDTLLWQIISNSLVLAFLKQERRGY